MDGYTVVAEVEETSEEIAARWAAYHAETDRMIRSLKLSQPMKDALSLWIAQSRNNSVMLALPPVKPVTMEAIEKRGLVKAYRSNGWKLTREDMGTGVDGARIARRIASLDGTLTSAQHAQVADRVKAVHARRDAQVAEMLAPLPSEAAQLPEIAGHSWKEYRERHASPGSPTDDLLGWQLIPDGKAVTVAASIMRREGSWLANGYRSGMSSLLSPTWEGTSLAEAGALVVDNIMMRSCGSCDGAGRRIGSWREDCDHLPMSDARAAELPGDAERAFDAENAAMEGASYEREAQAEFDAELAAMFPGSDDPLGDYAECRDQLAMEREGCSDCDPDDCNGTIGACKAHVSVQAWLDHTAYGEKGIPVKLPCEGLPFILTLSADAGATIVTGSVLVDRDGEAFTVTGARMSGGGTRVLLGHYANGGVGSAPYMRFPGLMWRTAPSLPWRPARDGENARRVAVTVVARVTMPSAWKTSDKGGKRVKGSRGWRK